MIIRSRLKEKGINAAIILLSFFLTGIYSCSETSLKPFAFIGNETRSSGRSFRVKSNISYFDEMPVRLEGRSVNLDRLKIKSYGPRTENSILFLNRYAH